MISIKLSLRGTFGLAQIAATALVLSGCGGAGGGEIEITGATMQALSESEMLSDAEATEAVRAVCVGSYASKGQCVSCVAQALGDLNAEGRITGSQQGALVSEIGDDECTDACMKASCDLAEKNCGAIPDGCGGTLECGGCAAPETCGGSGTANVCGFDPEVCDGVDRNGDGRWDTDVPSVCPTIQSALDVAILPGTIRVAPGVYHENLNFAGAPVTLLATGGASVTTIDAGQNGPAVTINHGEGSQSVLDGFTLTNGSGTWGRYSMQGGGLHVSYSRPTLRNLVVTGNSMKSGIFDSGGGAYITRSTVTISNSIFTGNEVAYYGGGLFLASSNVRLDHVIVDGNRATYGAGIADYYGVATIENSVISSNTGYMGNGAFIQGGKASFNNVSLVGNKGDVGSAVTSFNGNVGLVNVILSGGVASSTTGGAYAHPGSTITFDHCAFWKNTNGHVGGVENPIGANGNIEVDPGFVDASSLQSTDWDLHLDPASLLRNAGSPALQNDDGSVSDIGAYGGPAGNW
jgi:hypothetical protein